MMTPRKHEIPELLAPVAHADPGAIARLHERLSARAEQAGLLDVAYRTLDSPIGRLLVAATPKGVVRVAFANEGHERVLEELAAELSPRILAAPARLDPAARELDEYFAGARRHFELPLDFALAHGFRRAVLEELRRIDYGRTASYAAVAAGVGSPRAVRAVGTACAQNPLPLVVPCHRVVRSDGALGGYRGGAEAKRVLLELEAAA
jgi:methylated-DNA-[protein]-cysteine S-methyltransferase